MCPRCGGELVSAARHRAEMQAGARKKARRYVATGAGLVFLILGAIAWLLFGPGVAHGEEKAAGPTPPATGTTSAPKKPKKDKVAAVVPQHPPDAGVPPDPMIESTLSPRPVRVRLIDGSTVIGTVHAEEAGMLVVDCSLGTLSIPRTRIQTIAYDATAGVGQKRAPVQQLDDEDKPTTNSNSASPSPKKRGASQP